MSQVIVNPDELRRFAASLDELRESLQHQRFSAFHSFEYLRQTWRDAKYDAFEKSFTETCRELDQFLATTKTYAEFLRQKAAKADAYLHRS